MAANGEMTPIRCVWCGWQPTMVDLTDALAERDALRAALEAAQTDEVRLQLAVEQMQAERDQARAWSAAWKRAAKRRRREMRGNAVAVRVLSEERMNAIERIAELETQLRGQAKVIAAALIVYGVQQSRANVFTQQQDREWRESKAWSMGVLMDEVQKLDAVREKH